MKKTIALLVAGFMVVSVAGCTDTTENEGQWYKTLTQEWMTAGGCWEEDRIIECICEQQVLKK